jgi:hypothetical protein
VPQYKGSARLQQQAPEQSPGAVLFHLRLSPENRVECLAIGITPHLLAIAFPGERLLHAFLLARFQIVGVALHFLNDVFLLNFPFEAPQCGIE